MKSAGKGLVLAAVNIVFIAIGLGAMDHSADTTYLVMIIASVPGLGAGVALGLIADRLAAARVAARLAVLIAPALVVVVALATQFKMEALIPVASIPTVVAALILERWTRRAEPPPVPVARVR